LLRVRLAQAALWRGAGGYAGPAGDTLEVEIYDNWLEPATAAELAAQTTDALLGAAAAQSREAGHVDSHGGSQGWAARSMDCVGRE
jgi:hypothetical protein